MYRYDLSGDSFVNLPLSPAQASAFKSAWTYQTTGGIEDSNGVVFGGVYYQVYYNNRVRALNAATGQLIWTASMNAPTPSPCSPSFKGGAVAAPAVDNGTVFVPGGDGQVYAFNATTGALLWSTPIASNASNEFLWSSAFPVNGTLYQGVATFGGESTCGSAPGRLVAVSESTGVVTGTWWADAQHRSGGTIWTQPAYDATTGKIFVATGNVGLNIQPADEPYSQAVVAIDPATMTAVDSYQVTSASASVDYDFGASPSLVDTPGGQHLIVAVNKDGIVYALNRNNLAAGLVWSYEVSTPAGTPEDGQGSISSPTAANGIVFVGGGATPDGHSGAVAALNADTGAVQWVFHPDGFILAGLMSVGDVVVAPATGGTEGHLYVLSQMDGSVLYHLDDSSSSFYSQPTFAEGLLYANDETGNTYALQPGAPTNVNAITTASITTYNAADVGLPVTFSGTAESDATSVTVKLNGTLSGSTTLPGSSGQQSWSVTFSSANFNTLPDGPVVAAATVATPGGTVNAGSLTITKNVTPPGPITGFVANGGAGQVALSWKNPTDSDFSRTLILQSTTGFAASPTPSGTQTSIYNSTGTSTVATGLAASTIYYFTAFAQDTAGNYSTAATAQAMTSASSAVSFSDPFSECTSTTNLGPNWSISGTWYCKSGKARGESANGVALAITSPTANTTVSARVQDSSSSSAGGLVARASGTSYYGARILPTGHVQAFRVDGATVKVLGDVAETIAIGTSYALQLVVTGSSPAQLTVSFSGSQVLSVPDTSAMSLTSGQAGLYNEYNARTQFDTFALTGQGQSAPTNAITTASITTYNAADVGQPVTFSGTAEPDATGVTVTLNGSLMGNTALPGSGSQQSWSVTFTSASFNTLPDGPVVASATVATLGGPVNAGSLTITRNVTPPGPVTNLVANGGSAQVALTWTNPTDADYAGTLILQSTTGFAASPIPSSTQTAIFNGIGTSTTSTGLAASTIYYFTAFAEDSAGNWSMPTTAQAMTSASSPVSFSDPFSECTSTTNLGPNWNISGTWYCKSSKARGESANGVALALTSAVANTTVSVRAQLTSSTSAGGLVARAAGGSYYGARMLPTGHIQAFRVDGAQVTVLGDSAQTIAIGTSYPLKLVVSGSSPAQLTVSFNGTQVLSVPDASAASLASGQAGLYNEYNARTMYDTFSLSSF
jgi:outer membrane protein assembly factor BamB